MVNESLKNNMSKIFMWKFFSMFFILIPVIVPFFHSLGIGMKGVYLLQSIFSITVFVLEIPSGYISDILGRKKTLIVSSFLKAVGFSLFPLASHLNTLIIAEIILGIGMALSSGTDTALIYDTLEIVDPKKSKIKILGKSISYFSLGEGLASLIASVLMIYSFSIKHLAIISAITSWIPLIITFFLVEPPRKKMEKSHKENFKYIYKKLFQQSRLLNLIILNSVFSFAGTLFAVWIFQKYWTNIGIPIFYFGFLWATTNFAVSLSSRYAHKIEKKLGGPLLLVILGLLPIAGYFGISFFDHHILGFLVCLFFQVCRGVGQVILRDALNKRVTGDFRATANSVGQMGVRIFFTCLGPFLGIYIDSHGLPKGSLSMGVFYIFVFIFAMIPLIRERKNFISSR